MTNKKIILSATLALILSAPVFAQNSTVGGSVGATGNIGANVGGVSTGLSTGVDADVSGTTNNGNSNSTSTTTNSNTRTNTNTSNNNGTYNSNTNQKSTTNTTATNRTSARAWADFGTLDSDSNGTISRNEFRANSRNNARLFNRYDANNDGMLNQAELNGYFHARAHGKNNMNR